MFVFPQNYISVDCPLLFIQWAVVKNHTGGYHVWRSTNTVHSSRPHSALRRKRYLAVIYHHARFHSHLLAVQPRLCLGGRGGAAAVESEGPGALFRDIPGTGVSAESAGSWDAEGRMTATGRMGSEGRRDFAPPTTHLCFAHPLLPSVWQKSEHRRASRCTHGPLGRFPWSDLRCGRHKGKTMNHRQRLCIFS